MTATHTPYADQAQQMPLAKEARESDAERILRAMPETPESPAAPSFHPSDLGNAERLIARYGRDLRYVVAWKRWLIWNGTYWRQDEDKTVERFAKETVRAIYLEAAAAPSDDARGALAKHALRSEADGRIAAMLNRASAESGVAIRPAVLDADPWRLVCANGTLDLRNAALGPHVRGLLCTRAVEIPYHPGASCPRWMAFLDRVMKGNAALIAFLQRAIGYSLTGATTEQCLFLLHGAGANGKSTFLEILRSLAGAYAVQADFATFLEKHGDGPRNDVARLLGARVVTSSEVAEGKRFNETLVKSLTGTDTIAARFLYSEAFEFQPQFKLWFAANHKPIVRGTDDAIWRRMRLVPFAVTIPEEERDPNLLDALREELPGILAWAVAGCQLWLESGLQAPCEVQDATQRYRQESDILGAFMDDECELDAAFSAPARLLYARYKDWAKAGEEYVMSSTMFARRLEERGIVAERRGRDNVTWRIGARLIPQRSSAEPAWFDR